MDLNVFLMTGEAFLTAFAEQQLMCQLPTGFVQEAFFTTTAFSSQQATILIPTLSSFLVLF